MNTCFICTTCGVQYAALVTPPNKCIICSDDRQYINLAGQNWTTLSKVNSQYKNIIELASAGVYAIYTTPTFAIGQRAHLIKTSQGNILWDCITNLDASTIDIINSLGGIKAIAVSHPHYFSTINEWSKAFGAPVYIHTADKEWITRDGSNIKLWAGERVDLWQEATLVRCGGHFPGASVLYISEGEGSLFVGDTIQVTPGENAVSFMYSYPNMIPLSKKDILQIDAAVTNINYNAMYGAFGKYIRKGAKDIMKRSVERYLQIY